MDSMLICPVCKGKMTKNDRDYVCKKGHSFDRAKTGYVNLLQSQKSSAKRHGDDKLMIKRRTDFLEKGYYDGLRDAVVNFAVKYAPNPAIIVDVGCGECYYTQAVYENLRRRGIETRVCGIDISKDAINAAAKRNANFELCVAGIFNIPVSDSGCNVIINMFAPHSPSEFARILSKDGVYIRAIPLRRHLMGLKAAIYDEPYENKPSEIELDGFEIIDRAEIRRTIRIDNRTDMQNLFMMTPYYYKTGKKEQERFARLGSLTTETEFGVIVYKKK